jgi:hypothetical protein
MSTATVGNETTVDNTSPSPILGQFFPRYSGCPRSCTYRWDGTQWVLDGGDTCGGSCHCPRPPGNLKKLLLLEGIHTGDTITVACCGGGCNVLEPPIEAYIKLLIKFKLLLRIALGLGLFGAALAGFIIYALVQ